MKDIIYRIKLWRRRGLIDFMKGVLLGSILCISLGYVDYSTIVPVIESVIEYECKNASGSTNTGATQVVEDDPQEEAPQEGQIIFLSEEINGKDL